jgi:hypothetical protein
MSSGSEILKEVDKTLASIPTPPPKADSASVQSFLLQLSKLEVELEKEIEKTKAKSELKPLQQALKKVQQKSQQLTDSFVADDESTKISNPLGLHAEILEKTETVEEKKKSFTVFERENRCSLGCFPHDLAFSFPLLCTRIHRFMLSSSRGTRKHGKPAFVTANCLTFMKQFVPPFFFPSLQMRLKVPPFSFPTSLVSLHAAEKTLPSH